MCIRLATLAGVITVAITAMIKEINADQHLPLANSAVGSSAQAAGSTRTQQCGCSHGLESPAPRPAPTLRSSVADYFELELQKLRQAIIDAEAQREQADYERKLLENELNQTKRQLDAQIADLKGRLAGTPTVAAPWTKTPASARALGGIRSGPVALGASNGLGRARRTTSAVQIFGKPLAADCVRAVRPLHRYGPYGPIPPWDEMLR